MRDNPEVVLGFDYGTRRIGIAVGNRITGSARSLATLDQMNGLDWQRLQRILDDWAPGVLVVGLPLRDDGANQTMTDAARDFMTRLGERFALPVYSMDERYSTIEAAQRLRRARASGSRAKRLRKGDADAMAAQVILEGWLAEHSATLAHS